MHMQDEPTKIPKDLEEMRTQFYHYATQQHYILDKVNQKPLDNDSDWLNEFELD